LSKFTNLLNKKKKTAREGALGRVNVAHCFKAAAFTLGSAIASATKQFIGLE